MKEVGKMAQALLGMRFDTYMKSKYMLLAVSREHQATHDFIKILFSRIDDKRPLLIEMKEGEGS